MANDLSNTPTTGWLAQTCGDAHLENLLRTLVYALCCRVGRALDGQRTREASIG